MKRLRLDLTSLLVLALLVAGAIELWGETVGLRTPEQRGFWLSVLAAGTLVLAIAMSFDRLGRWWNALLALGQWLHLRRSAMVGTTQASVIAKPEKTQRVVTRLDALCETLKQRRGRRWRYRQPWLLLTGNDKAIARLLPALAEHGYLVTEEVVLLWHASDTNGQPDEAWLKQLYRLRFRRPIDAIVLTVNGLEDQFDAARGLPGPSVNLTRMTHALHWSAPVYVLDVAQVDGVCHGQTLITGCELARTTSAKEIEASLLTLRDHLAQLGVQQLYANAADIYTAKLSERLDERSAPLANWVARLAARNAPTYGVFFAPFPAKDASSSAQLALPLWPHLGDLSRRHRGRRVGMHPITVCSVIALAGLGLWVGGMVMSAFTNARESRRSQAAVRMLDAGDDAARLRGLLALQQRIGLYEDRILHHAPVLTRFGLNRDRATLDALWARYAPASRAWLTTPVQLNLEASLQALTQARADTLQSHDAQRKHYDLLKAYLMLAEPARVDAAFLAPQIANVWPMVSTMPPGEWQDTSQRLAAFFAQHLPAHPAWGIQASTPLISRARSALINQVGLANADDTVYQSILDSVRGKYADISLPTLLNGTDAQGLFSTTQMVPGVYTRAAWDGMLGEAIDKAASERHVEGDWVLTGGAASHTAPQPADNPPTSDTLKQRLTARYFAEYAAAWQHMLNSLQWQPAPNLNTAIDQLTRLSDAQTSPLIALMKAVQFQAQAGRPTQALGDTLVRRAQNLMGRDHPSEAPAVNPLDASFGPLLALMGDGGVDARAAANTPGNGAPTPATLSGVSLQSYLTAAITMRLKLQQIAASPDAQSMARAIAQAVFQGKLSDLAQVREQAALTSASLGSAWAGFGDALFARPLDTAWQTILQPAAGSLNELWRESIAAPFNASFQGHYPFADAGADASFAELGRYVRPDSGLIARFLTTQLAGVLVQQGDQWVSNGLGPQSLTFDPAFLEAMEQMTMLGAHVYAQGDAKQRFEIMALPTPNVTRSELTIDAQQIIYFNQQQTWTRVTWPGEGLNGHASLTWQTLDAGVRQAFAITGDWAFLRMLAQADIKPLDSTRYEVTWRQDQPEPLRYVLRTQVGTGPLELLELRGFILPERIFAVNKTPTPPPRSPVLSRAATTEGASP